MRVRRNVCLLIGGNSVKYTVSRKRRKEKPALVSKQVGAIFTILGGTSPCRGHLWGQSLRRVSLRWFGALSTLGRPLQLSPSNLLTDVLLILAFGSFTGAMIITGGALINSDYGFSNQSPRRRNEPST